MAPSTPKSRWLVGLPGWLAVPSTVVGAAKSGKSGTSSSQLSPEMPGFGGSERLLLLPRGVTASTSSPPVSRAAAVAAATWPSSCLILKRAAASLPSRASLAAFLRAFLAPHASDTADLPELDVPLSMLARRAAMLAASQATATILPRIAPARGLARPPP